MKQCVSLLVSFLLTVYSYAQINMGNLGTVTNGCGKNFYDSGGSAGNYGSSQNFTATFCAPAGQYITFTFSQFALGSGDHLKIYNGSSTSSPLIGDYMSASPGQVSSTLGGCITFVFTSDAPVLFITSNGAGWTAAISCATSVPPPPPPSPGTCEAAQPFCTSTGVTFPAAVGTSSQTGPNYGCLSTQPSPGWYYLNIATAGNIQINLTNSANHDIDFAIWGPFNTQAEMCNGTTAAPIDCSYSTAANEQVDIPNAQVGQWYIMLVTNYANTATNISALAGDAGGVDGTTNCNILCNMTNLTATPSACNSADNSYSVSGSITVQYPPTSGTLTVTSSCGGSVSIPTPWNSPISYTLPNLTANGAACSITASFSADPTCSLTKQITAPAACNSTPICAISGVSASPSSCSTSNTYSVSGQITFTNAPTSGTLTVNGSCGGSQVFNAPFTSPLNYTLSGITANGSNCTVTASFSATSCSASQTYSAPSLPIVNAGTDQAVCSTSSVTLTATGASTYVWSNGISNGVSFTPTSTATYTVTGTSSAGCVSTDQVQVTVNPLPTVNAGTDQAVCSTSSVTLTATGAATYVWSNGISNGVSFTPTSTATYTVTGTSSAGCVSTDQVQVTVNTNAPINAGSDIAICLGQTTNLIASGGVSYSWDNNLGTAAMVTVSPSITTTYTLNGSDAQGCTGTDQVVVTVNPLPIIDAGIDQTICAGQTIQLSASGGQSYLWDNGVLNGIDFSPITTTTFTVVGTSVAGCTSSDQVVVNVNPYPSLDAGNDQAICLGQSVILTASTTGQVQWNNSISNGVPFQPNQSGIYVATTSNQACISSDTVSVTVHAIPLVDAGLDQIICVGEGVSLTGNGASTYTWSNGISNGVVFYPSVGTATVYLTGYSLEGCSSIDSVTIKVNPLPTPVISSNLSYCTGTSVVLSLNSSYAAYAWSTGASTSTLSATTQMNPISVTVTDPNGCVGTSAVVSVIETNVVYSYDTLRICDGEIVSIHGVQQSVQGDYVQLYTSASGCDSISNVRLIVNPIPIVNAGADFSICQGDPVTLTAIGNATNSWDQNVVDGVLFIPNSTGTYTVTAQSAEGCVSMDQIIINVNPLPLINAGSNVGICRGEPISLTATGGMTYQWSSGIQNGVAFTPSVTQTYTVTGTDANGCVNNDILQVSVYDIPMVNAGSDLTVCAGESILLTATGAQNYTWNNNVQNAVSFTPSVGNWTYTVVGVTSEGCTDSDSLTVVVVPIPVVNFSASQTTGCAPLSVTFYSTSANTTNCIWTFSDGSVASGCDSISMLFMEAGCYDVTLATSNQAGCSNSFSINDMICVEDYAIAAFESSTYTVSELDPIVQFSNNSVNATSYNWYLGDGTAFSTDDNPSHNFANTEIGEMQVFLVATNNYGCADTTSMTLLMVEDLIYYVPNSFTPDGDNFNQNFKPVFTSGFDPFAYGLFIYDRWGELIFESHDSEIGWNGSYGGLDRIDLVQSGTYTWKIQFKVAINDEHKVAYGHVNVLK